MAVFTLASGRDDFSGLSGEHNLFLLAPSTLQNTDSIVGGGSGGFIDILALTLTGAISAAQFAGVENIEFFYLSRLGNKVALTNGLVAGTSLGYFAVFGGEGNDEVDATGVTADVQLSFYSGGGADTFSGGGGATKNYYFFGPGNLTSSDTVIGGSSHDAIVLTGPGTVTASAFSNVTNCEALFLSNAGNAVTLVDGTVTGANRGLFAVHGGSGDDVVNAAAVTAGIQLSFYAGVGDDSFAGGGGASRNYYFFAPGDLTSDDVVVGGPHYDAIVLTGSGAVGNSAFANVTNLEAVLLSAAGNSFTLSDSLVTGTQIGYFAVFGGAGNDIVDAAGITASIQLSFYPGGGNDTFTGGDNVDVLLATAAQLDGADRFDGGDGIDYLIITTNGAVADAALAGVSNVEFVVLQAGGSIELTSTFGASRVYALGSAGADVFDGSAATTYELVLIGQGGADTLIGGARNDYFYLTNDGFAHIDGNGANDYIMPLSPNQVLDITANAAKIEDIEAIWLQQAPGAVVELTGNDIATTAGSNALYIVGGADDQVHAGDGYALLAVNHINNAIAPGHTFTEYQHSSGALLFIDSAITATISAAVNIPPTVLLGGLTSGTQNGLDYTAVFSLGDPSGVSIADADAVVDDSDLADSPGISAHIVDLTATIADAQSGTLEYLALTAAGHLLVASHGLTLSGENSATLTIAGSATDAVYQDLLAEIHYVNADVSGAFDGADRHVEVTVHDGVGAVSSVATAALEVGAGLPETAFELSASIPEQNIAPTILLAGFFAGSQNGFDFVTEITLGDPAGIAVADADAVIDDPDVIDTPTISAQITELTATITNAHSGALEHLGLTGVGHAILASNGLAVSGENSHSLTIAGAAADAVYESLLAEIRYINVDVSGSVGASERHVSVAVHDALGAASNTPTTTVALLDGGAAFAMGSEPLGSVAALDPSDFFCPESDPASEIDSAGDLSFGWCDGVEPEVVGTLYAPLAVADSAGLLL